jgi:hypothetical protein
MPVTSVSRILAEFRAAEWDIERIGPELYVASRRDGSIVKYAKTREEAEAKTQAMDLADKFTGNGPAVALFR